MERERWGQLLITLGLAALVAALFATGFANQIRSTDAIEHATPELLEVDAIRDAIRSEFARSIEAAYAPRDVAAETLSMASERMVQNGDVVDEVARAVEVAHRSWLDGGDLLLELDPRVVTQAAISGLRDADLDLANAFPAEHIIEPEPIALPWGTTAASIGQLGRLALVVVAAALVMVAAGAVAHSRRSWTLKSIARAAIGAGALIAALALILPLSAVRSVNDVVSVVGALAEPMRVPMLVVAALVVFAGLWMRASADRLVARVERRLSQESKRKKEASPARSGGAGQVTRKGERHRTEAIDAFFEEIRPGSSAPATVIDLDAFEPADEESAAVDADADTDADIDEADAADADADEDHDEGAEVEPAEIRAKTPEQERAETIAAERREALERIDGTRSGNRTHLPR